MQSLLQFGGEVEEKRNEKGRKKSWDNIQKYSTTGFSICQEQKSVILKWIAHKMLNEVSIRSSIKSTVIWWKKDVIFWAESELKCSGKKKKSVAKYYIWGTASAYFMVIFSGSHSTRHSLGELSPDGGAHSQVLGVLWSL